MIYKKKLLNTELKYDTDEEKLYRYNKKCKKWSWVNPGMSYNKMFNKHVYNRVEIDKKLFSIYRLIYFVCHDDFDIFNPEITIDHININHFDNRLENLRTATIQEQHRNRKYYNGKETTGYTILKSGTYQTYYHDENRKQIRQTFKTVKEALEWREANRIKF